LIQTEKDKKIQKEIESTLDFNEAQTRKKLIDIMLKDAGWNVKDSEPRQIWGFYTLEDLEKLFFRHKYSKDFVDLLFILNR
jgi:hypothetical protein